MSKRSVLIALEWVPTYRTSFFELLRSDLATTGIDLLVIHGQPPSNKSKRGTDTSLDWATRRENRLFSVRGVEFCWQPVLRDALKADLVIVQQESSLLLNMLLAAGVRRGGPWAMWGHGANFNPHDLSSMGENLKRWQTRRADWFFAYTETSAQVVADLGVALDHVTVVNNAVDGLQLNGEPTREIADLLTDATRRSAEICWVNSSLDRWKRIDFLCDATDELKTLRPDFELIVVGGGEEQPKLAAHAATRPWIHLVGPRFGADKRVIGEAADLMLHPGLVGLHIVEAFQFGTPIVTTNIDYHSHEVSYLDSGVNGLMLPTDASAKDYAFAASELLADDERRSTLVRNGKTKATEITVEAMAERFASGIRSALGDA